MTVHLLIKGKVQGVFFRATAKEIAYKFGIKGWVKNTDNNEVEIIACGEEKPLRDFIEWCRVGPRHADVLDVVVKNLEEKKFDDFKVIR